MDVFGIRLLNGDRFIEPFFFDRHYNIFEIHEREDDRLKRRYCNICPPGEEMSGRIFYRDLAINYLICTDGRQITLDQNAFTALELPADLHETALAALAELQNHFK